MIWYIEFIPILTIAFLLVLWKEKLAFWELGVLLALPLMIIGIAKYSSVTYQVTDTEYWGGVATQAIYSEPWDEYISKTCSRECCCTTDSKGNRSCGTEYYDCSYVENHPAYWRIGNNVGESLDIGSSYFEALALRWKSRRWVDMHRNYYTQRGDAYYSDWDWNRDTFEPTVSDHYYENRVQASDSIFKFIDIPEDVARKKGLFAYPPITGYSQKVILGGDDTVAESNLQYLNGMLGKRKQVKVFILVYKGKPIQQAEDQKNFWKGGNKNELVIPIGISSDGLVQWCMPFSWAPSNTHEASEVETLKIELRDHVIQQGKLDLQELTTWLYPQIEQHWHRKHFKEFSYLTVEPSGRAVVISFIFVLIVCVGWAVFSVINPFDNELTQKRRSW